MENACHTDGSSSTFHCPLDTLIASRQVQHDYDSRVEVGNAKYPQLASTIYAHYSRFLDKKCARIDALYALSELFILAAISEAQILNLVEEKIVFETTSMIDPEHDSTSARAKASSSTLSNLWWSKKVLDEHLRHVKESRASIDRTGGPNWPRAMEEEPKVHEKVRATRDLLLRDYDNLIEQTQTLLKSCDCGMDIAGNNALVAKFRSAVKKAEWVAKLTLLTFFLHRCNVYHLCVWYELFSVWPGFAEHLDMGH
ncbi:MAG: hypothetical protein M1829_000951 [Trizodia sp. TS-e1964]|nr:MAG: hypothetical protein M1829_000951 [Trizodia sp. TS-e1964]